MKFVLYTNSVSAHQLPLAREIVKRVGADNFRYVYTGDSLQGGNQEVVSSEDWIIKESLNSQHSALNCHDWLENSDVMLVGGLRPFDLIERRCKMGLKTFYQSERWFKPFEVKVGGQRSEVKQLSIKKLISPLFTFTSHVHLLIPGSLRLLHPRYFRMMRRFVTIARQYDCFCILPIGVHAYNDFLRMGIPESKLTLWGYFVAPSDSHGRARSPSAPNSNIQTFSNSNNSLRVLWVGRMLDWKRVDTLIRAVALANQTIKQSNNQTISLTIVGDGPEKNRLVLLATALNFKPETLNFLPPVSISEVRKLMRENDVYVLPSNACEGWGAALNEAMEEGMLAIGTFEAGASATMLPDSNKFHAGDCKRLASLLIDAANGKLQRVPIGEWTAARAAERLVGVNSE